MTSPLSRSFLQDRTSFAPLEENLPPPSFRRGCPLDSDPLEEEVDRRELESVDVQGVARDVTAGVLQRVLSSGIASLSPIDLGLDRAPTRRALPFPREGDAAVRGIRGVRLIRVPALAEVVLFPSGGPQEEEISRPSAPTAMPRALGSGQLFQKRWVWENPRLGPQLPSLNSSIQNSA